MTLSAHKTYAAAALLLLVVAGCSGGGGFSGSKGKGSPQETANNDNNNGPNGDDRSDEGAAATEPQQVAGAFLMDCAYLGAGPGANTASGAALVGCGVYVNGTKVVLGNKTVGLQLFDSSKMQVPIGTMPTPPTSPFHVAGYLPNQSLQGSQLQLTVSGTSVPYQMSAGDIRSESDPNLGTNIPIKLGGSDGSSTDGETDAGASTVSSVTADALWHSTPIIFDIIGGFPPDDLCNSDGSIKSAYTGPVPSAALALESSSSGMSSFNAVAALQMGVGIYNAINSISDSGSSPSPSQPQSTTTSSAGAAASSPATTPAAPTPYEIEPGKFTFPDPNSCFVKFVLFGGDNPDFSQGGSQCYFLRLKDDTTAIISHSRMTSQSLSAAQLQAFARAHACTD